MSRNKRIIKDRDTGQPSIFYDTQPLSDTKQPLRNYKINEMNLSYTETVNVQDLPKVNTVFGGVADSLNVAKMHSTGMRPVYGVFWIIPPIIGISYIEIDGGYDICLRVLVVDALCSRLNSDGQLSVHFPLDLIFACADIEVGVDTKKKELFWKGKACYRGFDTGWRWRCAEGGGPIVRF